MAGPDCVISGFENIDSTMDITVSVGVGTVTADDGSTTPALAASWSAFTNPYILGIEFQYLIAAGPGAYTDSTAKSSALSWVATDGVIAGATYSVRYRASGNNVFGDWSNWISVSIPGASLIGAPLAANWSASGSVAGDTGTAPFLTITGTVDQVNAATCIVQYRQVITSAPTYGPWMQASVPVSIGVMTIPVNFAVKGQYQVHFYYGPLGGIADPSHYLDFSPIDVGIALSDAPADVANVTTFYDTGVTRMKWTFPGDYRTIDYEVRQGATWASAQSIGRVSDPLITPPGDGTYWVAAHYVIPNLGTDVYSANPQSVTIVGAQLTDNIVAAWDEVSTSWAGGALTNASIQAGFVQSDNGSPTAGYHVPAGHQIAIGRVATCNVAIVLSVTAQSITSNVLASTDFLNEQDLLGAGLGNLITAVAQIRVSQTDATGFGAWQNWSPGQYRGKLFDFQALLTINSATVVAVLEDLYFSVDVPTEEIDYVEHSLASGGETFTYPYTFNGGPGSAAKPNIQVTVVGGSANDQISLTGTSTTGFTLQVLNGGSGVARTVNIQIKGY